MEMRKKSEIFTEGVGDIDSTANAINRLTEVMCDIRYLLALKVAGEDFQGIAGTERWEQLSAFIEAETEIKEKKDDAKTS